MEKCVVWERCSSGNWSPLLVATGLWNSQIRATLPQQRGRRRLPSTVPASTEFPIIQGTPKWGFLHLKHTLYLQQHFQYVMLSFKAHLIIVSGCFRSSLPGPPLPLDHIWDWLMVWIATVPTLGRCPRCVQRLVTGYFIRKTFVCVLGINIEMITTAAVYRIYMK